MHPFRLEIKAQCGETLDTLKSYAETCNGLGRIEKQEPHGRKLAVVGGGPSILNHLEELRKWDGDIWAINSTGSWLLTQGIVSTFFTVDASPELKTDGMSSAILATCCHPSLRQRFQSVELFDLIETAHDGISGGTTSATRVPCLAIHMGYYDISFFGCESSFQIGQDHADRDDAEQSLLVIRAGQDYITTLNLLLQAECLAELMRLAPNVFKSRGGGLVEAMIKHPDTWEVVAVSDRLKTDLEGWNGKSGIYETPYEVSQCPSI